MEKQLTGNELIRKKVLPWMGRNYVVVAFILLMIYSSFASPVFATSKNLTTILLQNAGPGIIAMGMLYVIITGGIDLTVPSYVCLSVCLTAGFIQDGMGIWAIPVVMMIMVAFGFAIGFLVAYCKIAPFVVTLAFSEILKGIAYMYQGGRIAVLTELFYLNLFKAARSDCRTRYGLCWSSLGWHGSCC